MVELRCSEENHRFAAESVSMEFGRSTGLLRGRTGALSGIEEPVH